MDIEREELVVLDKVIDFEPVGSESAFGRTADGPCNDKVGHDVRVRKNLSLEMFQVVD